MTNMCDRQTEGRTDRQTEKTDWLTDQENILKFKYVLVAFDSLQFECMIIEEEETKCIKTMNMKGNLKREMEWNEMKWHLRCN